MHGGSTGLWEKNDYVNKYPYLEGRIDFVTIDLVFQCMDWEHLLKCEELLTIENKTQIRKLPNFRYELTEIELSMFLLQVMG